MTIQKTLPYRGRIQAVLSQAGQTCFVTTHVEDQATALYRLDTRQAQISLVTQALPCGATALLNVTHETVVDQLWLAGTDGQLYVSDWEGAVPTALDGVSLDMSQGPVLAMAQLKQFVLLLQPYGISLLPLSAVPRQSSSTPPPLLYRLAFSQRATVMAVSTDQTWLAVGDDQGVISTYQCVNAQLQQSASAQLHQGAVTALVFEPQQQRFFSAGADQKLYSTHAQGELQALDRGKNSNHSGVIHSLLCLGDRLYSGADDQSVKAWPLAGGQPSTCKQGLLKVQHLAAIRSQDQSMLLAICHDQSFRAMALEADGKLTDVEWVVHDGYAWAKDGLGDTDPVRYRNALALLTAYDDAAALSLISTTLKKQTDQTSRERLVTVLTQSQHPQSTLALEDLLKDKHHPSVRLLAFDALTQRAANRTDPLHHAVLALASGDVAIGQLALQQLADQASRTPRAEQEIVRALQHEQVDVRHLALHLLERLYGQDDPKASLLALQSSFANTQRAALIRLYQRQLLQHLEVKRSVALLQEHRDALVRQTAFWVAVLSQPSLAQRLQQRDADFTRPLTDLAQFQLLAQTDTQAITQDLKRFWQALTGSSQQSDAFAALEPLLQGICNRFADICFDAAYALALLQDQRAFGVLLRLAQDPTASIRSGVAKAFAALQLPDSKAVLIRMLDDPDAGVRDTALTAYGRLAADPLEWAMVALHAKHMDSHTRGLKIVLDQLSAPLSGDQSSKNITATAKQLLKRFTGSAQQPLDPAEPTQAAYAVLQQALNDPFEAIRLEATKACVNRQLGGDRAGTLQLLLTSQHVDVHQAVLTEWLADLRAPHAVAEQRLDVMAWFEQLLQNPFAPVRQAAFDAALHQKKRFDPVDVIKRGLHSAFVDMRRMALHQLLAHRRVTTDALLPVLFADTDTALRLEALQAALQVTFDQQGDLLNQALASPYDDVQMAAAQACAARGQSQAFVLFERVLQREPPQDVQVRQVWHQQVQQALKGLALLGDARGFVWIAQYIGQSSAHELTLQAAIDALPWVCHAEHVDQLARWLSDERLSVRAAAALGLAMLGDPRAWPALQDKQVHAKLTPMQQLIALNGLSAIDTTHLADYLTQPATRHSAQMLLLAHQYLQHPDTPEQVIHALSLSDMDTVLLCAGALVRYAAPEQRWLFWQEQINAWSAQQDPRWQYSVDALKRLALRLVHGDARGKAQAVVLLQQLDQQVSDAAWQAAEAAVMQRDLIEVDHAAMLLSTQTSPLASQAVRWQSLAFGAYVGVLRQQDVSLSQREQALRQLIALGLQQPTLQDGVQRSITPVLNHDQQAMRQLAYDGLVQLGMDPADLGQLAMAAVHADIAKQGLSLWLTQVSEKDATCYLQQLIQTSSPILSIEAWQMLQARQGLLDTVALALQSYYLPLRQQALQALRPSLVLSAKMPAIDPAALALVQLAAQNDDRATALLAAHLFAEHHLADADTVIQTLLWRSVDEREQGQLLSLLRQAPQPTMAQWLMDYVDHPQRRIARREVYRTIGYSRQLSIVPVLLNRLTSHTEDRSFVIEALVQISGYDQAILDRDDLLADTTWRDQQALRHDAVLIALFDRLIGLHAYTQAVSLLSHLAWAHDPAVDDALLRALPQVTADHQLAVVTCMARRAEKRSGSLQGLLTSLAHKQPDVQFVAAEGLAKRGQANGISILLAAIDHHSQGELRQRAVLALGQLGDLRAYDTLLGLAKDEGHYLQAVAIEAIGHLGQGEQGERVLRLLQQQLNDTSAYSDRLIHILNGLRWLNRVESWQCVREFSLDTEQYAEYRAHALMLLQHDPSAASQAVLLSVLSHADQQVLVQAAYHSAQHLFGHQPDQVYAYDLALLQGQYPTLDQQQTLQRVNQYATAAELFKVLQQITDSNEAASVMSRLEHSLLQRVDLGADILVEGLMSVADAQVIRSARYLAAHIDTHWTTSSATHTEQALLHHMHTWHSLAQQGQLNSQRAPARQDSAGQQREALLIQALDTLWWLVARYGSSGQEIDQAIEQVFMPAAYAPKMPTLLMNRLLQAWLARTELPQAWLMQLQAAWPHSSGQQRDWISHLITRQTTISVPVTQTSPVRSVSHADVVASIRCGDSAALVALAEDATQSDVIRLSAIEGLAHVGDALAEQTLLNVSQQSTQDPELAKAAYRALRRLQRQSVRQQHPNDRRAGASL